jgi:hypothetical protein
MSQRARTHDALEAQRLNINAETPQNGSGQLFFLPQDSNLLIDLRDIEFVDYLCDSSHVYRQISYAHPDLEPEEWQINFAGLQRTVLAKLQGRTHCSGSRNRE